MEVILKEDISKIGKAGDTVRSSRMVTREIT